jgi:DNA helicase-2/ATP-dependent DNA helicase PcrA
MKLSSYQQSILSYLVNNSKGNLLINAVAGSGKTTTLMELLPYCKGGTLLTAFNVSIAETLNAKIKVSGIHNAVATNIHKLGFKLITSNYVTTRFKINNYKYNKLIDEYINLHSPDNLTFGKISTIDLPTRQSYLEGLRQLTKLGQVNLLTPQTQEGQFIELIEHFALDIPVDYGFYLEYAVGCYNYCWENGITLAEKGNIDFNDMLTLPTIKCLIADKGYDYIFIDECQDLNHVQLEVILAYGKRNTRYFAVGDKNQAIYGFTGADADNFSRLGEILNAKELPLSVCYRCAVRIVQQAKDIVPRIEYAPNAVVGYVGYEPLDSLPSLTIDTANSVVLARKNSQLIKLFFTLLKAKIPSFVLGKDIGKGIHKYLDKFKSMDTYENLSKHLINYINDLEKRDKLTDEKLDKIECLIAIWSECTSYQEMQNYLDDLFGDTARSNALMLSSIHKSKGQEWDKVYLFEKHLPFTYPNQKQWQLQQEYNLKYVAVTRAKISLVWLTE